MLYTDTGGRTWRLPRHWLTEGVSPVIEASRYEVTHESRWYEFWCPPTWWDLWDINVHDMPAADGGRGAACVEVSVAPGEILKVLWRGPSGRAWRVPHDWRRRRIRLPDCRGLLRNGLPLDIAEELGGRIVAVNHHPGSLCCLGDHFGTPITMISESPSPCPGIHTCTCNSEPEGEPEGAVVACPFDLSRLCIADSFTP